MDFSRFEVMTFDCYGTLIDWEAGILDAIRRAFPLGQQVPDTEILEMYSEIEPSLQKGEYRTYRAVLREVLSEFGRCFGQKPTAPDLLAESLPAWKPFPDTVPALSRLGQRFKLGIISNTDNDLFAATAKVLKQPFAVIVTAEQVGTYKPSLRNFEAALSRFGVAAERVIHVAESQFHDIAPVREIGIASVRVNRHDRHRASASRRAATEPCLTVSSLAELAELCS
jgi:2-haloacid dehalogenase